MSGSVNKVILVGNLGRDPEIRNMQNGGRVANFSLATSERWTDRQSGERRERTEWHRIVIFNENLVDIVEKYVRKGQKVYLEGELQTRKWMDPQSNQERYTTEIVLNRFRGTLTMLSGRDEGAAFAGEGAAGGFGEGPSRDAGGGQGGGRASGGGRGELDDDIPF